MRCDAVVQSEGVGQRTMRDMLEVMDGLGTDSGNATAAVDADATIVDSERVVDFAPLGEEEVDDLRRRTAAFLLGEGR